jgi:hypothetical protein
METTLGRLILKTIGFVWMKKFFGVLIGRKVKT